MQKATISILILAAIASFGCKSTGLLAKREAEKCCPTDIRKTVPWCAGEDALFQCPCEPSATFYGYKPTCWRTWPTDGASWRDIHCGREHHSAVIGDLVHQNPELIELPALKPNAHPSELSGLKKESTSPEPKSDIKVPTTPMEPEPAPEPPKLPRLKELPELKNTSDTQPTREPEVEADQEEVPQASGGDLPLPPLGPVPLPPIDSEYAE